MRQVRDYKELNFSTRSPFILEAWVQGSRLHKAQAHRVAPYWYASLVIVRHWVPSGDVSKLEFGLMGPRLKAHIYQPDQGVELIGLALAPEALIALFNLRSDEVMDAFISLTDTSLVESDWAWPILNKAQQGFDAPGLLADMAQAVLSSLSNHNTAIKSSKNNKIAEFMRLDGGQAPIKALAAHFEVCERGLHRDFTARLGIGPKAYARLLRFNALLKDLDLNPAKSWAMRALDFGLSDQAHLNREFAHWIGVAPRQAAHERRHGVSDFSKNKAGGTAIM
ncbi:AraC family transcriptional regulator [Woodsholea maritima]|uniref:AraC family transcriptional regulator n=1 Tax=Woodsholea maritima TaxID=240237 RepID=UPI000379D33A|nr:helix-turn-helix domain-containing protein [Woodsholea maritima]